MACQTIAFPGLFLIISPPCRVVIILSRDICHSGLAIPLILFIIPNVTRTECDLTPHTADASSVYKGGGRSFGWDRLVTMSPVPYRELPPRTLFDRPVIICLCPLYFLFLQPLFLVSLFCLVNSEFNCMWRWTSVQKMGPWRTHSSKWWDPHSIAEHISASVSLPVRFSYYFFCPLTHLRTNNFHTPDGSSICCQLSYKQDKQDIHTLALEW